MLALAGGSPWLVLVSILLSEKAESGEGQRRRRDVKMGGGLYVS